MCSGLSKIPTKGKLSVCNCKIWSGTDEATFNSTTGIASGSHGSTVEGADSQGTRKEDILLHFLIGLNNRIAVDTQLPSYTTSVRVNRVAEILDTTDVVQWRHRSGINNPADIGTGAINIEEHRRSEWLIGPAWLKRPQNL